HRRIPPRDGGTRRSLPPPRATRALRRQGARIPRTGGWRLLIPASARRADAAKADVGVALRALDGAARRRVGAERGGAHAAPAPAAGVGGVAGDGPFGDVAG